MESGFLAMMDGMARSQKRKRREKEKERKQPKPEPKPRKPTEASIAVKLVPTVDELLDKVGTTYCKRHAPECFARKLSGPVVIQSNLELGDLDTIEHWLKRKHPKHQRVCLALNESPIKDVLRSVKTSFHRGGVVSVLHDFTEHALELVTAMVAEERLPMVVVLGKNMMFTKESARLRKMACAKPFVLPSITAGQRRRCLEKAREAWVPPGAAFDSELYMQAIDARQMIYGGVYMDYEVCNGVCTKGSGMMDREMDTPEAVETGGACVDGYGATDYVNTVMPHVTRDIFDLERLAEMQSDMAMLDWKLPSECAAGMSELLKHVPGTKEQRKSSYLRDLSKRAKRNEPKTPWLDYYAALDFSYAGHESPPSALRARMPMAMGLVKDRGKVAKVLKSLVDQRSASGLRRDSLTGTAREMGERAAELAEERCLVTHPKWREIWGILEQIPEGKRDVVMAGLL
jgi:hypothetical protein